MARNQEASAAQPGSGPGRVVFRVVAGVVGIVLVAVLGTLLIRALGNVTGGWRIVVAALMGLAIARLGIGYFYYMTHPPPPDPEPMRVDRELGLSYVCEMCGLELAVVAVAKERPPRHCGESMQLVRQVEG